MKKFAVFLILVILAGGGWWVWMRMHQPAVQATTDSGASFAPGVGAQPVASNKVVPGDKGVAATQTDPIAFATNTLQVTITKHVGSPSADGSYLLAHATKCGPPDRPATYFHDMVTILDKLPKTTYTISNGSGSYMVTFIPNLVGYKDLTSAQADFFSCPGDTGHLQAVAESTAWLVFVQPCADSDTDCKAIAAVVNPTIKIK